MKVKNSDEKPFCFSTTYDADDNIDKKIKGDFYYVSPIRIPKSLKEKYILDTNYNMYYIPKEDVIISKKQKTIIS